MSDDFETFERETRAEIEAQYGRRLTREERNYLREGLWRFFHDLREWQRTRKEPNAIN